MGVKKKVLVGVLAMAFIAAGFVRPPAAAAIDSTTPVIIGAAAGGAVALILVIAIVFAKKDDTDMPLVERAAKLPERGERRLGWARECRPDGPNLTLFCW